MSFSEEEKNLILCISASGISATDEKKWQELGEMMGRDWMEVRDAYQLLEFNNDAMDVVANGMDKLQPKSAEKKTQEIINNGKKTDDHFGKDLENGAIKAAEEVMNTENLEYIDDIQEYVQIDGETFQLNDFNQFLYSDTDVLANINCDDQAVTTVSKKRSNNEELDAKLIETMINQSEEELEFKRQEHEKKMKIYAMHLQHGKEQHEEKMKILRSKLRVVQEKIYHIDYALSNKNLHKRYRSGPI